MASSRSTLLRSLWISSSIERRRLSISCISRDGAIASIDFQSSVRMEKLISVSDD